MARRAGAAAVLGVGDARYPRVGRRGPLTDHFAMLAASTGRSTGHRAGSMSERGESLPRAMEALSSRDADVPPVRVKIGAEPSPDLSLSGRRHPFGPPFTRERD